MRFSVVVLAWNGAQYLEACLNAVLAQQGAESEVIVVDNASTDHSVEVIRAFLPHVRLIQNESNLGFAGGNNVGLGQSTGDVVVLLNQDTVVQPGWRVAIAETFADPDVGIVGCKALFPDGETLQHAGAVVERPGGDPRHLGHGEKDVGQYDTAVAVDYVTGAAFAIRRSLLDRLGGLDEGYRPAFFEEVDYCLRARRAGFQVVYQPRAVIYHHESTSWHDQNFARLAAFHRNRLRFILRHWSPDEFEAFCEHEAAKLQHIADFREMRVFIRAYLDGLLHLFTLADQRHFDRTLGGELSRPECDQMADQLQSLYWRALNRLKELYWIASNAEKGEWLDPFTQLILLRENAAPVSKVPLVGPLITRLRTFILNTFIRPYVVPIFEQQLVQIGLLQSHVQLLSEELLAVTHTLGDSTHDWPRSNEHRNDSHSQA
jgi:GT2 family glycosyltransferase